MSKPKPKSKRKSPIRAAKRRRCYGLVPGGRCPAPALPGCTRCAQHIRERNAELAVEQWTTRSGARIPITQMSDGHLANSIAMLARKLTVLTTEAARRARDATMLDEVLEPSPNDWERD